jgi:hypothetical protein
MKNVTVRMARQILRNERKPLSFTKQQAISLLEFLDKLPVKCYDNGGDSFDRYTVVFNDLKEQPNVYEYVGMSSNPFSPSGFCQHGVCIVGKHLGKRIAFSSLPDDCKVVVRRDLAGLDT